MSWIYSCPHCGEGLNPRDAIMLIGSQGPTRVLVGLDPTPGNYEAHMPPGVKPIPGTLWSFSCPACQTDLKAKDNPSFCGVHLTQDGQKVLVLFSRMAGEHATLVVEDGEVADMHGDDVGPHLLTIR